MFPRTTLSHALKAKTGAWLLRTADAAHVFILKKSAA
jgi:hypothetical protein